MVLDDKVFVFNFENLKCIDQIDTCENLTGIAAISQSEKPTNKVVVCPHKDKGMLVVHIFVMNKSIEKSIRAHESDIGALAVNPDGTLIASASTKGTLIRVMSVDGGDIL